MDRSTMASMPTAGLSTSWATRMSTETDATIMAMPKSYPPTSMKNSTAFMSALREASDMDSGMSLWPLYRSAGKPRYWEGTSPASLNGKPMKEIHSGGDMRLMEEPPYMDGVGVEKPLSPSLIKVSLTVTAAGISMAVMESSPSPCAPWMSPMPSPHPATWHVRKSVVPMPMRCVSVLPKKSPPANVRRQYSGAEPPSPQTDCGMAWVGLIGQAGPP
eukprot:scaffold8309_cov116-Isochrysis_galbana.AAC.4